MKKKVLLLSVIAVLAALVLGTLALFPEYTASIQYVSGTEYQGGEEGSVIIRVVDAFGRAVSANWCNISIYYPNGNVWVDNQAMTSRSNPPSTWVYSFVTPFDIYGNYHSYVTCEVSLPGGRTTTLYADKAFHVSRTLSLINNTASAQIRILT